MTDSDFTRAFAPQDATIGDEPGDKPKSAPETISTEHLNAPDQATIRPSQSDEGDVFVESSATDFTRIVGQVEKGPIESVSSIGEYEIIGVLGRGGMGIVYQARHLRLRRVVAIKMIIGGIHSGTEARRRFQVEAESIARLQHPNIVQVHEIGDHNGLPFAALEYVDGGTLSERMNRGQIPFKETARCLRAIAAAVHLAHTRNIIHRDLKPANILLTANGTPKVSDFGLARQLDNDSGQTQSGAVMGTPSYMSPEQAAGRIKELGPASDIYSLGAILYACLAGRPPFDGHSMIETLDHVRHKEPIAPHLLRPGVPADLETICLKCLQKEPDKRYASADSFGNELQRWLNGEPIFARPVSTFEKVTKWAYRNPASAILIVALQLFLVILIGVSFWSNRSIQLALEETKTERLKSQRILAGLAFDKGLQLVEQNKLSDGMLWLAESLAETPNTDLEMAQSIRTNLAGWSERVCVKRRHVQLNDSVNAVIFAPDGQSYFSAVGNSFQRWNTVTGETIGSPISQPSTIACIAIDPTGKLIATGNYERELRIWDAETGEPIGSPLPQVNIVNCVEFSRDGNWVACGSGFRDHSTPGTAQVYEVRTGKPISPVIPHPDTVRAVKFHSDGTKLITGGYDGLVRTWDISTGSLIGEPTRLPGGINALAVSPNGFYLAYGCASGKVGCIYLPSGQMVGEILQAEKDVQSVGFSPDESLILASGYDGTARIWNWESGYQVSKPLPHGNYVNSVTMSPNGRTILTGSEDEGLRLFDVPLSFPQGLPIRERDPELELSLFDSHLTSARPRPRIFGSKGRAIPHWISEFLCAAFTSDGKRVVVGSIYNKAYVFDTATGTQVGQPCEHNNWVRAVAVAPDDSLILTGSHDMTAKLWDVQTGKQIGKDLQHNSGVVAVAFSPNGNQLATAANNEARIYDRFTREPLGPPLVHRSSVSTVLFSHDSRRLLTVADRNVRIWDVATARPLGPGWQLEYPVHCARFSTDDHTVYALCDDAQVRSFSIPLPIEGSPNDIREWVQVICEQELDERKVIRELDLEAWEKRTEKTQRTSLAKRLSHTAESVHNWHDSTASAHQSAHNGFPALWHLRILRDENPDQMALVLREAEVFQRYGDSKLNAALARIRATNDMSLFREWADSRASNLQLLHRHQAALWYREQLVREFPMDGDAQAALGNCLASLGRFSEARQAFGVAVSLQPDRHEFRRRLALTQLILDEVSEFQSSCAELVRLAQGTTDRGIAVQTALTCALRPDSVADWNPVITLAQFAASGYEGDRRVLSAVYLRAGDFQRAAEHNFEAHLKFSHIVWEWFFEGLLRLKTGRLDQAKPILIQKFQMIELMDKEFIRDPNSKLVRQGRPDVGVWSNWEYFVQCHVLQDELQPALNSAIEAAEKTPASSKN